MLLAEAAAAVLRDCISLWLPTSKGIDTCYGRSGAGQCDSAHELQCSTVAMMNLSASNAGCALAIRVLFWQTTYKTRPKLAALHT